VERGMASHSLRVRGLAEWRANLKATLVPTLLLKGYYGSNTRCRTRFHHQQKRDSTLQRLVKELRTRDDGGTYDCLYMGANYNGDDQTKGYSTAGHSVNKSVLRELVSAPLTPAPASMRVPVAVRVCPHRPATSPSSWSTRTTPASAVLCAPPHWCAWTAVGTRCVPPAAW